MDDAEKPTAKQGGPVMIQLREADFVAAMRSNYVRTALSARSLLWGCVIAAVFVGWLSWLGGAAKAPLLLAIMAVPTLLGPLISWAWVVPRQARRMFSQAKSLHDPARMIWDDEGFRLTNKWEDRLTPWAHLHRWREDERSIVLYLAENVICPLPKTALSAADLADVRGRAAAAGVPGA